MARYKFIAMSNAKDGRETEYNDWYDKVHFPDMLKLPGVLSGERLVNVLPGAHKYVAIYEVEADGPEAFFAEITARAGTSEMTLTDAIDNDTVSMSFLSPYSP